MYEYIDWLSKITQGGERISVSMEAADYKKYAEYFGSINKAYPKGLYNYDMPSYGYKGSSSLFWALTYADGDLCQ